MKLRNVKKWVLALTAALTALIGQGTAEASTIHEVHKGESLWILGQQYGVSINELKQANNKYGNIIHIGEKLTIPTAAFTSEEQALLEKLVEAEAKGEPFAGKVAVATVVLNRVDSSDFPDTIKEVIYEQTGGSYAFTPVQNGAIHNTPSNETKRAVAEAIATRGGGQESLFFYNPKTAQSDWIKTRPVTAVIGNHTFAK
ncbi:N-acetylmuramoyl-L-alanine amidase [Bacillus fengqiuensis]|nr:N-acetylmuramoyl-L-alanine amidase [Bacillus fengqiuensis]